MHDQDGQSSNSENRFDAHISQRFDVLFFFSFSFHKTFGFSFILSFALVWHLISFSYSIWSFRLGHECSLSWFQFFKMLFLFFISKAFFFYFLDFATLSDNGCCCESRKKMKRKFRKIDLEINNLHSKVFFFCHPAGFWQKKRPFCIKKKNEIVPKQNYRLTECGEFSICHYEIQNRTKQSLYNHIIKTHC